jgi:hypothetical protein
MIIKAEREKVWSIGKGFFAAVIYGIVASGTMGLAAFLFQLIALICCVLAATELMIVTDPIWRYRQRADLVLDLLDKVTRGLGRTSELARAGEALNEMSATLRKTGVERSNG